MSFTAEDVKKLREKTGVGMMVCKEALTASKGNMDEAVEYLRKKGLAMAEKKAGRATADGLIEIATAPDGKSAVMIEVNCETDFVAKTEQFKELSKSLSQWALRQPKESMTAADLAPEQVEQIKQTIVKVGENVQFKRGEKIQSQAGLVEGYLHLGSKLGVLVELDGGNSPEIKALARDLAMQVAASSPQWLSRKQVPAEVLEKEKAIYQEQVRGAGKPENVVEKIVTGKIEKFHSEVCLLEQAYVKDPQKNVEAMVRETAAKAGATLEVKRFVRFRLGE
ncbi:elongation factor Ts [candidate division TA06 bacterium]|uniref:Elongation factor Ts n=1 Tax=candidate division TA06 bacterium TaxID=2250710 RepID=A0A933I7H3_UNCT6|nr:elongation factor Ts [candidate division TA06 bacterium]